MPSSKNNSSYRPEIAELQRYIRTISRFDPSIPSPLPIGVYEDETRAAVTMIQKKMGMKPTGTVDPETWDAVCGAYKIASEYLSPPVPIADIPDGEIGMVMLQAMLKTLSERYGSIPAVKITGVMDTATAEAIRAVQIIMGEKSEGLSDRFTYNALVRLFNNTVRGKKYT